MAKKKQAEEKAKESEKEVSAEQAEKSEIQVSEKSSQENSDYAKHLKFSKFNLSQGAE